ncbi:MAG TPA: hypothetical protein G4N98_07270 [Thermoflexia bacterium]|nr:hypothetical protein [Thermoflexia bacterium]
MDLAEAEVLDVAGAVDLAPDGELVWATIKIKVSGPRGRGWPVGLDIGARQPPTCLRMGHPVAKSPHCERK